MPFDLQSAEGVVGLILGLLAIIAIIFGWFGKAWRWVFSLFRPKAPVGIIEVPSKTMVLIPVAHQNALWWCMGAMGDQPMMQIVGDLNVTNISKYGVHVMGAKLRKPRAVGHANVRAQDSNTCSQAHIIPQGGVSHLRFEFFVQPPVCDKGKLFKADVAIIDQFGNEHGLKGLEFPYT